VALFEHPEASQEEKAQGGDPDHEARGPDQAARRKGGRSAGHDHGEDVEPDKNDEPGQEVPPEENLHDAALPDPAARRSS
jgi:hypothetical protein